MELVVSRTASHDDERPQSVVSDVSKHAAVDLMASEWTQVQAIELVNDGTGLGFGEFYIYKLFIGNVT